MDDLRPPMVRHASSDVWRPGSVCGVVEPKMTPPFWGIYFDFAFDHLELIPSDISILALLGLYDLKCVSSTPFAFSTLPCF